MYRLELKIDSLPRNGLNARQHWTSRKREADFWDQAIELLTTGQRPAVPLKKAKLTLTRRSSVRPDYDGLVATWKHPIDALVSCGILSDDSFEVIGMPEFHWEHAPQKKGKIEIIVDEIA